MWTLCELKGVCATLVVGWPPMTFLQYQAVSRWRTEQKMRKFSASEALKLYACPRLSDLLDPAGRTSPPLRGLPLWWAHRTSINCAACVGSSAAPSISGSLLGSPVSRLGDLITRTGLCKLRLSPSWPWPGAALQWLVSLAAVCWLPKDFLGMIRKVADLRGIIVPAVDAWSRLPSWAHLQPGNLAEWFHYFLASRSSSPSIDYIFWSRKTESTHVQVKKRVHRDMEKGFSAIPPSFFHRPLTTGTCVPSWLLQLKALLSLAVFAIAT